MKQNLIFLVIILPIVAGCGQDIDAQNIKIQEKDMPQELEKADESMETQEPVNETSKTIELSSEVEQLLGIADRKVKSISYKYKGPETNDFSYEFFIKENRIKYIIDPAYNDVRLDEDAYDTIYISNEEKTAFAYCDSRKCRVNGKKADLNYGDSYILTPFDWLNNIGFAEKIGEELIERRTTWKLLTSGNEIVWVDSFFGVPMQAELNNNIYKFQQMSFNNLKDEDVIPKD